MTPKQFYYTQSKETVEAVIRSAKTSMENFKQIAVAGGSVGKRLAERLAIASEQQMTELEILYPERFEEAG